MNEEVGEQVFQQIVDTLIQKEAYTLEASDDYWLQSDCFEDGWDESEY